MPDQTTLQQSSVLRRHESGQRSGTSADWVALNPILGRGEIGYATDTGETRTGDGSTPWNSLPIPNSTTNSGTYAPISSLAESITYNSDGTVATVTETASGAVTTYTYNADGTPATEARVLNGATTTRTFSYTSGNLTAVN